MSDLKDTHTLVVLVTDADDYIYKNLLLSFCFLKKTFFYIDRNSFYLCMGLRFPPCLFDYRFVWLFDCLFVSKITQKPPDGFPGKMVEGSSMRVWNQYHSFTVLHILKVFFFYMFDNFSINNAEMFVKRIRDADTASVIPCMTSLSSRLCYSQYPYRYQF